MPRPSLTGTGSTTEFNATRPADLTMTIPADADVLCVCFGGFEGTPVSLTSVQGDPTGTPYNLDDVTEYGQRTNAQYAGFYAIDKDNANWPGTGSVTVRITISRSNAQLKGTIFCLKDVDTATAYRVANAESASGTPSVSVSSSSNSLNIGIAATYSADVGGGDDTLIAEVQNGGSASSLYCWHEDGTGATDTVEANASVAYHMRVVSFEGTGGGGGPSTPQGLHGIDFGINVQRSSRLGGELEQ